MQIEYNIGYEKNEKRFFILLHFIPVLNNGEKLHLHICFYPIVQWDTSDNKKIERLYSSGTGF